MFITKSSIQRPIFMTMVLIAIVLFGGINFFRMGIDLFPKVEIPVVTIISILPGADPESIETTVSDPIEEAISTVSSIKSIRSKSGEGVSQVIIEFELEKDINVAFQEVQAKVGAIRSKLPSDLVSPVIQKFDFDALPVLSVFLSAPLSIDVFTNLVNKEIKEVLQRVPNVGEVKLIGGREKKMWLFLDRNLLESHQVTIAEVEQSLRMHHLEIPGGRVQTKSLEMPVKVKAEFSSKEDFDNWIVAYKQGAPIRIRDLGSVEEGLEEERSISEFNSTSAMALLIKKQSGTNTVEVAEAVKKECIRLQGVLEKKGVHLQVAQDNSLYIHKSVDEVYFHLLFGGGLAVLIVLLFLRNFRSTIVCALALPTAVIGTFSFMYAMGFTQNMMTLLAISIAIGLLIDDAIVVQENIMRHVEMGYSPKDASLKATEEIAMAVLATTLTVVAVFVPVAFVKGMIGKFFYQFGLTIAFAVLISLFVSFTLNPMFSSLFLREIKKGKVYLFLERVFQWLERKYHSIIEVSLRYRKWVVIVALISFVGAIYVSKFIHFEFRPQEDQSEFQVSVELPKGQTLYKTKELMDKVKESLKDKSWLSYTFTTIGGDQMQSVNMGNLYVKMVEKKERKISQEKAMNEARALFVNWKEGKIMVEPYARISGGGFKQVEVHLELKGPDLQKLSLISSLLMEKMRLAKGYRDINTSYETGKPQVDVHIRRDMAADLGVSPMAIALTIKTAIGGTDVAKFRKDGNRYDVGIRLMEPYRQDLSQLELLSVKNQNGQLIPLKNLVEVSQVEGPVEIDRCNRSRQISLYANLNHEEKVLGDAMKEIGGFIKELDLPLGYSVEFSGHAKQFKESFQNLVFALLLGVLIVYMVLAAQFESFLYPFIIMLSLPLSLIGALGSLVIFGQTLSIFTMIGIILLMGLVTKNGILLVDLINTLRSRDKMERNRAVCKGGQLRLRPILMTTLAIIFGMLPIALGTGSGSESRGPMAIAVIGGLVTSTLLTLIVVPVVYTLLDDMKVWMRSKVVKKAPEGAVES
ncbi:MAG: efflux RND transporter permease subunit [Chlamydiota bacterium]